MREIKLDWKECLSFGGRKMIAYDIFGREFVRYDFDANGFLWREDFHKFKEKTERDYSRVFAPFICAGLKLALEVADTHASEEVEKEARTRFVWGQVVGARKVRAEIQALLDKLQEDEVSNG